MQWVLVVGTCCMHVAWTLGATDSMRFEVQAEKKALERFFLGGSPILRIAGKLGTPGTPPNGARTHMEGGGFWEERPRKLLFVWEARPSKEPFFVERSGEQPPVFPVFLKGKGFAFPKSRQRKGGANPFLLQPPRDIYRASFCRSRVDLGLGFWRTPVLGVVDRETKRSNPCFR